MTQTPIADAISGGGPQPAHAAPRTIMSVVHGDLQAVAHAVGNMLPVLEAIALSPDVDKLVAEALTASRAGVAAEYFTAATDVLRNACQRQAAAQQPAPAGDGA